MPRTQLTAPGNTDADSADQAIASGASMSFGIFVTEGALPSRASAEISVKTPGANIPIKMLSARDPIARVNGPCTVVVSRRGGLGTFGTFSEN